MKTYASASILAMLAWCLVAVLPGCSSNSNSGSSSSDTPAATPLTIVHVGGAISTPTTWTKGNLYVIDSSIMTSATLTIEPGTIVKFSQGTAISVNANGAIVANGQSASTPIIFTSLKDDIYGGDTNEDKTATAPSKGDWSYISVNTTGSTFDHCVFSYGGSAKPYSATLELNSGCTATVTNSVFAHNQGGTLTDTRAAALNAGDAGAGTVLKGNTFYDNDMPLVVSALYSLDNSNVFHQMVSGATVTNKYNGIFFDGPYNLTGNITWSNTDVPYVILGPLSVDAGSSLTLADNVVVKFDAGQRIEVPGTLTANAATGITFTSIKDDTIGGDTNGDGMATPPAPGDWKNVSVSSTGSVFNKCRFFYGGSAKPYSGTLDVSNANVPATATITNCTFAHNAGGAPADNRAATLNVGGAGAGTIVTGNTFYDNDMPMVINGLNNIDNTNVFHAVVSGVTHSNKYNGIFMDGVDHIVTGSVTWSNTEVPYVIAGGTVLTVGDADGANLTLGNNVIVKIQGGRIDELQYGAITQGTGNYFTSFKDDFMMGDNNGDGMSMPMKGDWAGVNLCKPLCSYATWGNILYATNP